MRRYMGLLCLFSSTMAFADTAPTVSTVQPPPPEPAQGMRLRNGFSLTAGQEWGSGPSDGLSGQLYGADWRIGLQIDELHAVYAQSHLSFGNAKIGSASGATGNFAFALMAERVLPARVFVAGGGGYGILNNPDGLLAQARVGWYPFEQSSVGKVRRLNVAADARWYFAGEQVGTVTQVALTIGYDRF